MDNLPAIGDIIRSKKDRWDYVVQGITIAVGGGVISYGLLRLLDSKLRTDTTSIIDFLTDHSPVWHNHDHLPAEEVLSRKRQAIADATRSNRPLFNKLNTLDSSSKEAMLRDILSISQEAPTESLIKSRITDIVDIFLDGGVRPSDRQIREALRNLAKGTNYSEEFISSLADQFASAFDRRTAVTRSRLKPGAGLKDLSLAEIGKVFQGAGILAELGLSTESEFGGTAGEVQSSKSLIKSFMGWFGGPSSANSEFITASEISRAEKVFRDVLDELPNGGLGGDRLLTLLNRALRQRGGINNKVIDAIITGRLRSGLHGLNQEKIIGRILDAMPELKAAAVRTAVMMRSPWFYIPGAGRQTNRRTATRHQLRSPVNSLRPGLDYELLAQQSGQTKDGYRYFAFEADTFFNDLVGDREVTYKGTTGKLSENITLRQDIMQSFAQGTAHADSPSKVIATPGMLREILKQAREGEAINLDSVSQLTGAYNNKFDPMLASKVNVFGFKMSRVPLSNPYPTERAVSFLSNAPTLDAATEVQAEMSLIEKAYQQGRKEGYESTKAAMATIRGRNTVLATEVGNPIPAQIERARRALTEDGHLLLDIETIPGTQRLRQATLRQIDMTGAKVNFKILADFSNLQENAVQEANSLLELTAQIQGQTDKTILTQSGFDFETIIRRLKQLQSDETVQRAGLAPKLEQARIILGRESKRVAGFELIPQVAGHRGSVNQNAMMLHYFKKAEEHTSKSDTLFMGKLMFETDLGSNFLKNLEEFKLIQNPDQILFGAKLHHNYAGQFLKLKGIMPDVTTGELRVLFEQMAYQNGKLEATGSHFEHAFDSAYQARAAIEKMTPVNSSNLKELIEAQEKIIKDLSARMVRGVGPHNRSIWDAATGRYVEDGFEAYYGKFGLMNLRVTSEADKAYAQLQRQGFKLNPNWTPTQTSKAIEDAVSSTLTEDSFGHLQGGQHLLERARFELARALNDDLYAKTVFGPGSVYKQMMSSEFGKALIGAYDQGLQLPFPDIMGTKVPVNPHFVAPATYIMGMGRFAESVKGDSTQFIRQVVSDPRLSFHLGPVKVNTGTIVEAASLKSGGDRAVNSLLLYAAESKDAQNLLQNSAESIGVEMNTVIEAAKHLREVKKTESQIVNYKLLVDELSGHGDLFTGEFSVLGDVRHAFMRSNEMQDVLVQSIEAKAARHAEGSAQHNAGLQFLNEFKRRSANLKDGTMLDAFQEAYASVSNQDALESLLQDNYFEHQYDKIFTAMDKKAVKEASKEAQRIVAQIKEQQGDIGVHAALARAYMARSEAAIGDEKLNPLDLDVTMMESLRQSARAPQEITPDELHQAGLWYQEIVRGLEDAGKSAVRSAHEEVAATARATDDEALEQAKKLQHQLQLLIQSMEKENSAFMGKFSLGIAGVLGAATLLGMKDPEQEFSQGNVSDDIHQTHIGRYAEIPGPTRGRQVWEGDSSPFQLDLRFEGMIQSKKHEQELIRQIHNAVGEAFEIQRTHVAVTDRRRKNHTVDAIQMMKGNVF